MGLNSRASYGIPVLDDRLTGPIDGGLHSLIGGPGAGKSVAALQFLNEGLRRDERVAMLSPASPESVVELARSIGIDLADHLSAGAFVLMGYQSGFRERYRRTLDSNEAFEEFLGFLREGPIGRLVLDSCGPLVESREAGIGGELLVEMLGGLGATTLLTFTAEGPGALGSAFDPVFQASSLILHTQLNGTGRREFIPRKVPGQPDNTGPITFEIRQGVGIVASDGFRRRRASDVSPETRRRILLLDLSDGLQEELRLWFDEAFDLHYTRDAVDAFPELAAFEFGVVVVHVDRRSVARGIHVLSQLRRTASRPPILVICNYDVRASDRAGALRAGADDFISGGLHPEELSWRIAALLRRARTDARDAPAEKDARPAATDGSSEEDDVMEIVRAHLASAAAPVFSLLLLRPLSGQDMEALAGHVADHMRHSNGDRLSVRPDHVEVYLHGALSSHAQRFLQRVKVKPWEKVGCEVYTAPVDRSQLLGVIAAPDA